MKRNQFDNNIVVVAGCLGSVGLPLCVELASRGAKVIGLTRNIRNTDERVEKLRSLSVRVEALDLSEPRNVVRFIHRLRTDGTSVAGFVNAACFRPGQDAEPSSFENWGEALVKNSQMLSVPLYEFTKYMSECGGGRAVNISSIYGEISPWPEIYVGSELKTELDYPFLKSGSVAFARYLAVLFAESGVTVNSVALGGIFSSQPEPFVRAYSQRVPMKRMAEDADVTGPIISLLSDDFGYVTGQCLMVDGGLSCV